MLEVIGSLVGYRFVALVAGFSVTGEEGSDVSLEGIKWAIVHEEMEETKQEGEPF